jgi:hypothetical protein
MRSRLGLLAIAGCAALVAASPALGAGKIPRPTSLEWFSASPNPSGFLWGESQTWGWSAHGEQPLVGVTSTEHPAIRHAMVLGDGKTLVATPRAISRTWFSAPSWSTDGGRTWEPGTPPLPHDDGFSGVRHASSYVATDPANPDRGWYCDGALYETMDRGVSWDEVASLRIAAPWSCAAVDVEPRTGGVLVLLQRVAVGAAGAPPAGRILRSGNGGRTWTPVASPRHPWSPTTNLVFAFDPARPATVWLTAPAPGTDAALYRSTTAGARWQLAALPAALRSATVEQYAFAKGRAIALLDDRAGAMHVVQSTDHGATWREIAGPVRTY